jgi:hypothetical protein
MKNRPKKTILPKDEQIRLRDLAIQKIKSKLLPNDKILKIIIMGSSVKGNFGEYEPPGFRDSLYSDFDFIVFVTDDYIIPKWFNREPDGKPFPNDSLNLAYRNKNFIENKYDVEVFFIKELTMQDNKIKKLGEEAGIPMSDNGANKHIIIYSK